MQFRSRLARYYFEKYVSDIAIATLEKGGTVSDLKTYRFIPPVDNWKFPKYPGKTVILPHDVDLVPELKNFIMTNESLLRETDCLLGTWIHPQTQHFYFDVATSRNNFEEARKLALEFSKRDGRKIVALYNSARNETYYL